MPFVYSIQCNVEPCREYIGQTNREDLAVRMRAHKSSARTGKTQYLYNAIRKYGWENFTVRVLHTFPKEGDWQERLDRLEIYEIAQRNTLAPNGYNLESGGHANKTMHEDTKQLMSLAKSGRPARPMTDKDKSGLVQKVQVEQWSNDGQTFIRRFDSIKEASEIVQVHRQCIYRVCRGSAKTAGGFCWRYTQQANCPVRIKYTAVQQWELDGQTLLAEFDSIQEAADETGINRRDIGNCLRNKRRSTGGFKWRAVC